jgi:hypothetical protein
MATLAAGFVVVTILIPPTPGVTEGNYYRLRSGMTEHEANKIMGSPGKLASAGVDGRFMKIWEGDGFLISAAFAAPPDAGLTHATFSPHVGGAFTLSDDEKGFFGRMRRMFAWCHEDIRSRGVHKDSVRPNAWRPR